MVKRKTKSSALGDDPLAWIGNADADGKVETKKVALKKKRSNQKPAKKTQAKKKKAKKIQTKKDTKRNIRKTDAVKKSSLATTEIKLDSVLVISDVQTIHTKLIAMLDSEQNVTIDASGVEMLDTAMLQLLLAFVIKVKSQNREVIWINPSEAMTKRVTTLNLQAGLGLDRTD